MGLAGVTTAFADFSLDDAGAVRRGRLVEMAARAAVLVDLATTGALRDEADGIGLDTAPTGFAPADELLADIDARPGRSLDGWLEGGPDLVDLLVTERVSSGAWERRRHHLMGWRYLPVVLPERTSLAAAAAARLLAHGAGLIGGPAPAPPAEDDPVGWVLDAALDRIASERSLLQALAQTSATTVLFNNIP